MASYSAPLAAWFAAHHGVVHLDVLESLGISRGSRRSMIDDGLLIPVHRGVYRSAFSPFTFRSQCAAASMADPTVVVSCMSAGRLWGLRACVDSELHVTTSLRSRAVAAPVVLHRTVDLPDTDIVDRVDGIRVTTPPRTYFDIARHVDDLRLESIAEQMIDLELCTFSRLEAVVTRLAAAGRPGGRRAMRVLHRRPADRATVDSHLELLLLRHLEWAGVEGLVVQPEVVLPSGRVIHPDLGLPAIGFYIEVDHHTWHGTREARDRDTERDRQLRLTGAVVERVTDTQILDQIRRTVHDLITLIHHRNISFGSSW